MSTPVFRVAEPGMLTTIQDLGRPGAIASGVPNGGAMDRFAHAAANLLVGNERGDATLECTIKGPQLVAERPCLVAVTGADVEVQVNGRRDAAWTGLFLAAGDRLGVACRRGYIAVAGGFDGDRWLGSRATYLLVSRGGMKGRPLKAGDELHLAAERPGPHVAGRHLSSSQRPDYSDRALAAIPGPHVRRLDKESRRAFFGGAFALSTQADRMGYRLDGPQLTLSGDELLSFGLAAGAVQVVNSGQAILLMADSQTAGGYAVVATVITASLPVAAQLLPGDEFVFREINETTARQRRQELNAALASLASS